MSVLDSHFSKIISNYNHLIEDDKKDFFKNYNNIEALHDFILYLMGECNCDEFRKSPLVYELLKILSFTIPMLDYIFKNNQLEANMKKDLEKMLYYSVALEEFLKRITDDDFYELVYEKSVPKDLFEFGKLYYRAKDIPRKVKIMKKVLTDEQIENLDEEALKVIEFIVKHG